MLTKLDDIFDKLKDALLPPLSNLVLKAVNVTISYQVGNEAILKKYEKQKRPIIIAIWHDQLWYPSYYLKDRGYIALADISRLGDCISHVLEKSGFEMVRGSTSRGGTASLRKLLRHLKANKVLTITPDGPRGPRHEVKSGIVYLSQMTEAVIIPLGVSYKNFWALDTWDEFMVPKPLTKAGLYFGLPVEIEQSDKLEEQKSLLSARMNQAAKEAEKLVEAK